MTVTRSDPSARVIPDSEQGLIAEYLEHLRVDRGRAASTIDTYDEILRRMNRQLPVGLLSANTEELRAWLNAASRQAASTRKVARAAVVGLFDWLCDPEEPRLDFNPAQLLATVPVKQGKPRPLQDDELRDILARAARPYRDWFLIAAAAGARCQEIASLDRRDVSERLILLHGKGGKDRYLPTHPLIWELAQQLPSGPVAVGRDGRRLTRAQISHRGNYYLQQVLGHLDVHMHRLRHTFGTQAMDECGDLRVVQELLGHASPATTAIYVAASTPGMRQAVAGLRIAV